MSDKSTTVVVIIIYEKLITTRIIIKEYLTKQVIEITDPTPKNIMIWIAFHKRTQ